MRSLSCQSLILSEAAEKRSIRCQITHLCALCCAAIAVAVSCRHDHHNRHAGHCAVFQSKKEQKGEPDGKWNDSLRSGLLLFLAELQI